MKGLIAALSVAALSGCATHSPALHTAPAGKQVVYELPPDQAQRIVRATMGASFPGREIEPLKGALGYTTYTRMMLDTWTTTATVIPVQAKTSGKEFPAVRIETNGSGTQWLTGKPQYERFKERLTAELDSSGAKREVDGYVIR